MPILSLTEQIPTRVRVLSSICSRTKQKNVDSDRTKHAPDRKWHGGRERPRSDDIPVKIKLEVKRSLGRNETKRFSARLQESNRFLYRLNLLPQMENLIMPMRLLHFLILSTGKKSWGCYNGRGERTASTIRFVASHRKSSNSVTSV